MAGFYESPDNSSDTRAPLEYTCKAPATNLGATGSWASTIRTNSDPQKAPGDCEIGTLCKQGGLKCLAGKLSVNNSIVGDLQGENKKREVTQQRPYKQKIADLQGYQFGPSLGPMYQFTFVAKDVQGNPRAYTTLKTVGVNDYVAVDIRRVDLGLLDGLCTTEGLCEKALQPQSGEKALHPIKSTWNGATSRAYVVGSLNSQDNTAAKDPTNSVAEDDQEDGVWHINHQFTEHGVFFVSLFVCEIGLKQDCINRNSRAMVPGSGPPDNKDELPTKAFTICPQGTKNANLQGGIIAGANLAGCQAIGGAAGQGFFSPAGPGTVSQFCPVGFQCLLPGTYWPIAEPGYWVSDRLVGSDGKWPWLPEMTRCLSQGACPGSNMFHSTCPALPAGSLATDGVISNFENVSRSIHFGQGDCYTETPPNKCPPDPKCKGVWGEDSTCVGLGTCAQKHCLEVTGSQCCLGNTGNKCSKCCDIDDKGKPSCDGKQWHRISMTGGQSYCDRCLEGESVWWMGAIAIVVLILAAPVLSTLSELVKHAGAVQGPLLSILNFFQSVSTLTTTLLNILILNPRKSLPRQLGFIGDARMNVLLARDHVRVAC
jgi:hypothetical protein